MLISCTLSLQDRDRSDAASTSDNTCDLVRCMVLLETLPGAIARIRPSVKGLGAVKTA